MTSRIQHTVLNIPSLYHSVGFCFRPRGIQTLRKFWSDPKIVGAEGWHLSSTPRTQMWRHGTKCSRPDLCTPVQTKPGKKVFCTLLCFLRLSGSYPLLHTFSHWRTRSCWTWQSIFCLFMAGLVCLWSPPLFVDVPSFSPELRNMHLFAWFSISAAGYFL
jgi:hypothetical protein